MKNREINRRLTKHRQLDSLDEDPCFSGPHSVHHHEAIVTPRVSDLNITDDQRTVPGPELVLGNLHPALKLRRLPLQCSVLFKHCVSRVSPLDVAGGRSHLPQARLPSAGKNRLVPHLGGDGQEVGGGGQGRGVWKKTGIEGGNWLFKKIPNNVGRFDKKQSQLVPITSISQSFSPYQTEV